MTKIISNKSNVDLDYPVVRPSLDLDFTQEELDPRITFSRGSIGTRVNRNRLIETVAANQPRFDYDPVTGECKGLLIEESRINSLLYSQDFSNASWIILGLSFSYNNVIGLDGTTTASTFTANSTSSSALNALYQNFTCTASTTYTFSFYIKLGTLPASSYKIAVYNNTGASFIAADVVPTQTLSSNSWTRVSYTFTTPVGCVSARVYPYRNDNRKQNNGTFYLWGAQLEASGTLTSYIPTSASTVTRSTDLARMTGTNFSSWYNPTEGTLYAAVRTNSLGGSGFPGIAYVDDGTPNNCIGLVIIDAVTDRVATEAYVSGANQYLFNSNSAIIPNQLSKVITSYSANNFSSAFSGRDNIQRDIRGSIPTVNRLLLGELRGGSNRLNGVLARFTYYPRKLKDNQLLYLTQ